MTNAVAIQTPLSEKYGNELDIFCRYGTHEKDRLLAKPLLLNIVAEVDRALIPAEPAIVTKWVKNLLGGYPAREMNDPKIFANSMVYDLKDFPEDIIAATVHKMRRECKFLPTCSEVYQEANRQAAERKWTKVTAEKQLKEHARREEEAEKRRREESERTPEQREEMRLKIAALRENLSTVKGATAL